MENPDDDSLVDIFLKLTGILFYDLGDVTIHTEFIHNVSTVFMELGRNDVGGIYVFYYHRSPDDNVKSNKDIVFIEYTSKLPCEEISCEELLLDLRKSLTRTMSSIVGIQVIYNNNIEYKPEIETLLPSKIRIQRTNTTGVPRFSSNVIQKFFLEFVSEMKYKNSDSVVVNSNKTMITTNGQATCSNSKYDLY